MAPYGGFCAVHGYDAYAKGMAVTPRGMEHEFASMPMAPVTPRGGIDFEAMERTPSPERHRKGGGKGGKPDWTWLECVTCGAPRKSFWKRCNNCGHETRAMKDIAERQGRAAPATSLNSDTIGSIIKLAQYASLTSYLPPTWLTQI